MNLNQTITQLRAQYVALGETLDTLITGVGSPGNITNIRRMTNPPRVRTPANVAHGHTRASSAIGRAGTAIPHGRTLSTAGRKAIAAAQRKRWAVLKGGGGTRKAA